MMQYQDTKKHQTTKQWLYSVRAIERRKRTIVCQIADLKVEHETVLDTATAVYGSTHVQSGNISEPTLNKAIILCDKMTAKLDVLISELELLTLESDTIRDEVNACFESCDMKVEELEALFYYFFEGMSNVEVANAMYYSLDMVYKLKASAIKKVTKYRSV